MKHNYILIPSLALLALAVAPQGWARSISEQRAIELAQQFTHASSHLRMAAAAGQQLRVAHVAQSATTQAPLYYAIEQGTAGGFVLVAGDDLVQQPVLAYCDHGNFSYDEAPANVKWWLDEYARIIEYAAAHGLQVSSINSFDANVGPLLTTQWNQLAPYYNYCPTTQAGTKTVTGCVATAMAQVFNYYEWPKQGTGSHTYEWDGQTLSADFGATTYDWDNMLDTYDENSPEAANDAVATLMYHCGVSVDMIYGDINSAGSSAFDFDVAAAAVNYFGYGKDLACEFRKFYTLAEWAEMLKAELDASRPIFYCGQSTGGGHAFVIDGYNTEGLFHVNWGWGGMSDGYYSIVTLNPYEGQGAGAGSDSYYYGQDALFNLHPADGTEESPLILCLHNFFIYDHNNNNLPVYSLDIKKGESVLFRAVDCYNLSVEPYYGYIGLSMVDEDMNEVANSCFYVGDGIPLGYSAAEDLEIMFPTDLADGTYYIFPGYAIGEDDTFEAIRTDITAPGSCIVTVAGDDVHLEMDDNRFSQIECSSVKVTSNSTLTDGEITTVECSITNNSDESFLDELTFVVSRHGVYDVVYEYNIYESFTPYLVPGETVTVSLNRLIDGFTPIEGENLYDIYVYDMNLEMPVAGGCVTISLDGSGVDNVAASKAAVSVYPNPVAHQLSIQASGRIDGVTIYDLAGATVLRTTGSTTIDVAKLPAGVYMVKIDTPAGFTIEKVVKK